MTLRFIRAELARNPENPDGDPNDAYEFTMPLNAEGAMDVDAWHASENAWTFTRYHGGEETLHGQIVETDDGDWAFSYEAGDADDEKLFSFDRHRIVPDEYLSVTDTSGVEHVYRMVIVANPPGV